MLENLKFNVKWHWNMNRHTIITYGIMAGAIITGSLLLTGTIAEAGRHRN
jgi:hypothetical protein